MGPKNIKGFGENCFVGVLCGLLGKAEDEDLTDKLTCPLKPAEATVEV